MFCDIKEKISNCIVLEIMGESAFDNSPEAMANKAAEFCCKEDWKLFGWIESNEILGVCGFEVHADRVEILNIAVSKNVRNRGIGHAMITALRQKYEMVVEAETDDDAVDFYRKCGFKTTETQKYDVRRWICVLPLCQ